jgi:hypothetical protein
MMRLYWIVHIVDGKPLVFIQESAGKEIARLKASLAGFSQGRFSQILELDEKTGRKVPKKMIGRALDRDEANALLKRIGK